MTETCTADDVTAQFELNPHNVRVTLTNNSEVACEVGVEAWSYNLPVMVTFDPEVPQNFIVGKYLTLHGVSEDDNGRDNEHVFTLPINKLEDPECAVQVDAFINDGTVGHEVTGNHRYGDNLIEAEHYEWLDCETPDVPSDPPVIETTTTTALVCPPDQMPHAENGATVCKKPIPFTCPDGFEVSVEARDCVAVVAPTTSMVGSTTTTSTVPTLPHTGYDPLMAITGSLALLGGLFSLIARKRFT